MKLPDVAMNANVASVGPRSLTKHHIFYICTVPKYLLINQSTISLYKIKYIICEIFHKFPVSFHKFTTLLTFESLGIGFSPWVRLNWTILCLVDPRCWVNCWAEFTDSSQIEQWSSGVAEIIYNLYNISPLQSQLLYFYLFTSSETVRRPFLKNVPTNKNCE